jgi:hypothetical protein
MIMEKTMILLMHSRSLFDLQKRLLSVRPYTVIDS